MTEATNRWMQRGILGAVGALVIGVYAYTVHAGSVLSWSPAAAYSPYNLLVEGFQSGQLNLKRDPPPSFAQLADPYDPTANAGYGVTDLSYYRGKFYLYYGVTPALLLLWPYAALTGQYLSSEIATLIFCSLGFLVSAILLWAIWRRYFTGVGVVVVSAGLLALGLATGLPMLLTRCQIYEVAISCAYALTMLALAAIWKALHDPHRRCWWLASASLAFGLALGARPSLLFGAAMLLVPVVVEWRDKRKIGKIILAAIGPITLVGLGLMIYNWRRFDNPFEFGLRYALAGDRQPSQHWFSLQHLWFNFRLYFLEPASWSSRYPFVHDIHVPPLPAGHGRVEHPFGVLTNVPVIWLAIPAALVWLCQPEKRRSGLALFIIGLGILLALCALTICCFFSTSSRYEVDFLPALALLAAIGLLSVEQALAHRPAWQWQARVGGGSLLILSVAFNLFVAVERFAELQCLFGNSLTRSGKFAEASYYYAEALRINPDYAEAHCRLGNALLQTGRLPEAIGHYEEALRLNPDYAEVHNNLGVAFTGQGRLPEAIEHFRAALRAQPIYAEAQCNLADALFAAGQVSEAIGHYEEALRIQPGFELARNHLAKARAAQ